MVGCLHREVPAGFSPLKDTIDVTRRAANMRSRPDQARKESKPPSLRGDLPVHVPRFGSKACRDAPLVMGVGFSRSCALAGELVVQRFAPPSDFMFRIITFIHSQKYLGAWVR